MKTQRAAAQTIQIITVIITIQQSYCTWERMEGLEAVPKLQQHPLEVKGKHWHLCSEKSI